MAVYVDCKSDESYTPNKFSILAGNVLEDMKEVLYVEMNNPSGWFIFPLKAKTVSGNERWELILKKIIRDGYELSGENTTEPALRERHSYKASEDIWTQRVNLKNNFRKSSNSLTIPAFSSEILSNFTLR